MDNIDLPKMKEEKEEEVKPLSLKELIKEVLKFTRKANITNLIQFFIELIVIALIVMCLKFPFSLLIELVPKIFEVFGNTSIMATVNRVVDLIFNIVYTIFGLYVYYKICSVRFANLSKRK